MTETTHNPYNIITGLSTGEYEEKKSRFIAYLSPVATESDASDFIASIKKKHYDAKHNCSAFILGPDAQFTRCSDDKEPSGTAGKPMLEVLQGAGLTDIVAVVTRYFGGVLLGTGGLVRAYSQAVKNALSNASIATVTFCADLSITVDYSLVNTFMYYFENNNIRLLDTTYAENVTFLVRTAGVNATQVQDAFTKLSLGKARIITVSEGYYPL